MAISGFFDDVAPTVLANDLPDRIEATIISMEKGVKAGQFAGAPLLKFKLKLKDGVEFTTTYRVPKSWTGRGQMDKLLGHFNTLGLIKLKTARGVIQKVESPLRAVVGKTFIWERQELSGGMKGNDRHYPTKIIE